jgi:hypothetical protein
LFDLGYLGGWACFVASIAAIGLLTAFIGDAAAGFGCTIGLKDSVNAITFVAMGTSLPGESRRALDSRATAAAVFFLSCQNLPQLFSSFMTVGCGFSQITWVVGCVSPYPFLQSDF